MPRSKRPWNDRREGSHEFAAILQTDHFAQHVFFMKKSVLGENLSKKPQMKKRLAPRSQAQFKIGPPFEPTVSVRPIFTLDGTMLQPAIDARCDRGFDSEKDHWVGYKRNYFALVTSFRFQNRDLDLCSSESFYTRDVLGEKREISCFKLGLFDICPKTGIHIKSLIQHTSKRDKGPQFEPPVYFAVPGILPLHDFMKLIANIRSSDRVHAAHTKFFLSEKEIARCKSGSVLSSYRKHAEVARVARYERIQFLTNFPKLTVGSSRLFKLEVRLLCELQNGETVILARAETPLLIIRGRSPLNYTNGLVDKENMYFRGPFRQNKINQQLQNCKRSANVAHVGCSGKARPKIFRAQDIDSDLKSLGPKPVMSILNLLSPPMVCLTPRTEFFVTLKLPRKAELVDESLHSQHLSSFGECSIIGSPSTPTKSKSSILALKKIKYNDLSDSLANAVSEYVESQMELRKILPNMNFDLDLPVPLAMFPLNGNQTYKKNVEDSFFRLPPPTMGEPVRYCKHGCKMRHSEEKSELFDIFGRFVPPHVQLESTSFLEDNPDSSLLRFRNLLSRIKSEVRPELLTALSPLTNMSSSFETPIW